MKKYITFFFCLCLAGCLSHTAVLDNFKDNSANIPFTIDDQRPSDNRDTETLSILITSCDYNVLRIGDADVVPDRVTLLKNDLHARIGDKLKGKSIFLKKYTIHYNPSNHIRGIANSAVSGGLVTATLKPFGSNCPRDEMTGGWYEGSEVKNNNSPIIIEIEAAVGDRNYSIRSVYTPELMYLAPFHIPEGTKALFEAIRQATDMLASEMVAVK